MTNNLRRRMEESTIDDRWTSREACEEALDALDAANAEIAHLREERDALAHEVELTNEHEHQIMQERDEAREELSRLRSSPAPVVGGVPELTSADLWDIMRAHREIEPMRISLNAWFRSRLPALKPGELEALQECADVVLEYAPRETWTRNDTALTRAARRITNARAQPTPTEKETDHV